MGLPPFHQDNFTHALLASCPPARLAARASYFSRARAAYVSARRPHAAADLIHVPALAEFGLDRRGSFLRRERLFGIRIVVQRVSTTWQNQNMAVLYSPRIQDLPGLLFDDPDYGV